MYFFLHFIQVYLSRNGETQQKVLTLKISTAIVIENKWVFYTHIHDFENKIRSDKSFDSFLSSQLTE